MQQQQVLHDAADPGRLQVHDLSQMGTSWSENAAGKEEVVQCVLVDVNEDEIGLDKLCNSLTRMVW